MISALTSMQKVNFDSCAGKLHKIICRIFHRKNLFTCFREFVYNILLKAVAVWLKCNEENIPNACIAKVNARVGVPLPPKPAQAQREQNAFKVVHGNNLVSLEVFSQHKSWWSCRQLLYVTVFFSPPFLCLFNIEFQNLLLYVPSVPSCSFLLSFPSDSFLFFFLFYVLFVFPLFIRFIFWSSLLFSFQICYPFFSLSYYSVLSASPLCSIPIKSVLFLLVFILWYRAMMEGPETCSLHKCVRPAKEG